MDAALKEKLEKVVELVNNTMVEPEITVEYCIPEVETDADSCNVSGEPYITVKYDSIESGLHEKKIPLHGHYLEKTPEDLANLITFYIEQFMMEVDNHM